MSSNRGPIVALPPARLRPRASIVPRPLFVPRPLAPQALPAEWMTGARCLDVGCHEGMVAVAISKKFHTTSYIGYDIDAALVGRAFARLRSERKAIRRNIQDIKRKIKRHAPPTEEAATRQTEATAETEVPGAPNSSLAPDLSALEAQLGAHVASLVALRPVEFRHGNIVDADVAPSSIDVALCLSVAKWIHICFGESLLRVPIATVEPTYPSSNLPYPRRTYPLNLPTPHRTYLPPIEPTPRRTYLPPVEPTYPTPPLPLRLPWMSCRRRGDFARLPRPRPGLAPRRSTRA